MEEVIRDDLQFSFELSVQLGSVLIGQSKHLLQFSFELSLAELLGRERVERGEVAYNSLLS